MMGVAIKLFKQYFFQLYQVDKGLFFTWTCLWDFYLTSTMKKPKHNPEEIINKPEIIYDKGNIT